MTKTNEQFESLLQTLVSVRDSLDKDLPESLLHEIVSAHVDEPDTTRIYQRVQQAIEQRIDDSDA